MTRNWILATAWVLLLAGCHFGRVEQGRAVGYDAEKGTILLVRDSNYREPGRPRFDVLPAEMVKIPQNRDEMGPVPEAGKLLGIDRKGRRLITFDAGRLRTFPYTPLAERLNVRPGGNFPAIDRLKKVITIYDPAARVLLAFAATDDQLALPPDTWKAGDEVRFYYKQPGQALRLMNVTKTDIH